MLLDVMRDQHRKRGHEPKQGATKWVETNFLGAFNLILKRCRYFKSDLCLIYQSKTQK